MSQTTYRHYKRLPVDLFVNKFIGDEPFACRTRDLSVEGAYLRKLIEPMKMGDDNLVGLEFALPGNNEVIWASGVVVREEVREEFHDDKRTESEGVAVRFVSMADRHKKMLIDFIENAEGWVVPK